MFRTGDCIRGRQDTYVCDLLSLDSLTGLVERWVACPGLLPAVVSIERSCDIRETSHVTFPVYLHQE